MLFRMRTEQTDPVRANITREIPKEKNMLKNVSRKKIKSALIFLIAVLLVVCISLLAAVLVRRHRASLDLIQAAPLKVTFVDVGQGDGIVIECEDTTLVIDGGEYERRNAILRFLRNEEIKTIDCYIASHPHADHIGAAADIVNAFDVRTVMMTTFSEINVPTTVSYETFMTAVDAENCDVLFASAGESYTFGELKLDVLSPSVETGDYNNMSLVIKMTYKDNTFLFTGDAEAEIEQQLLDSGADLSAQVLKIGHHGSSTSSCDSFISAVLPQIAVISCGLNNDYGHPHRQTLDTLEKYEITVYRTDQSGNIVVYGNGKEVTVA